MIEKSYIDNYLKELKEQGKPDSYITAINTNSECESIQDFEAWLKGNYSNYKLYEMTRVKQKHFSHGLKVLNKRRKKLL